MAGVSAEDVAFVVEMVVDQYGEPRSLSKLQQYAFDWRGIYRVDFASQPSCVLRLINDATVEDHFRATAQVLHFLEAQGYPAPRVMLTRDGNAVGRFDDWRMLMVTFIEGERITPSPEAMRLQAETAAQLHCLPLRSDLRGSRWHPYTVLDEVEQGLISATRRLPVELHDVNEAMLATVERLRTRLTLPHCLVHGDCWYMNAVRTSPLQVTMIDWDWAGQGVAVFDLAYLLLTSHYDLSKPLEVVPNTPLISAIVAGYISQRQVSATEQELLFDAIRLVIAYAANRHYAENESISMDDFVVRKIKARFDATEEITRIADQFLRVSE